MATPNIKLVRSKSLFNYGNTPADNDSLISLAKEGEIEDASGAIVAAYVVLNPAWNKRLTNSDSHAAFKALMQTELGADHIEYIAKGLKSDRFYFEAITL